MSYPIHHNGRLYTPDGEHPPVEAGFCSICGKELLPPKADELSVGYAIFEDLKVCYECCATLEERAMDETGIAVLYLSQNTERGRTTYSVTNWPGTLKFMPIGVKKGKHNWINVPRYDVWFLDKHGNEWHGINLGDNQILRCRRNKTKKGRADA